MNALTPEERCIALGLIEPPKPAGVVHDCFLCGERWESRYLNWSEHNQTCAGMKR